MASDSQSKREKTLEKIVTAIEKIAEDAPNLEPLSEEDLRERRKKIDDTFKKLDEKNRNFLFVKCFNHQ